MTNLARPNGVTPGERAAAGATAGGTLIRSGADLVELVERLYLRLFAITLWLIVGAAGLSVIYAGLQPQDWHGGLTPALAVGCAAAALATFKRGPGAYLWLRGQSFGPALPGALGAALLVFDGPYGPLWFIALAGISTTAVLASPRQTIFVAVAATGCYVLGTLLAGGDLAADPDPGRLSAAGGLTLDGLLCAAVVDWLARFVLRLHKLELERTGGRRAPVRVGDITQRGSGRPRRRSARALPRGASRLTARQLEVVMLVRDGLHHEEIAACLAISPRQVERLAAHARARVGAQTTAALIALLVTGGLVPPQPERLPCG